MKSVAIMRHSIVQVMGNLPEALRVALVPYLAYVAIYLGLSAVLGVDMSAGGPFGEPLPVGPNGFPIFPESFLFAMLLSTIISMVMSMWIAVAWHRFVLLGEQAPGFIPQFRGDRILSYFGHSLLLGLIAFLIMLVLGFVAGFIGVFVPALGTVLMIISLLGVLYIVFRLSLILPAAALGESISLKMIWDKTKPGAGAIAMVIVFEVLIGLAFAIVGAILGFIPVLGTIIALLLNLPLLLIYASVLTTLYGHYIQGRELV